MQILNNVYIVRTAIYQWRWWNEIKISNGLKEINVFINKNDEQSVSKRQLWCDWAYKRANTLTEHLKHYFIYTTEWKS